MNTLQADLSPIRQASQVGQVRELASLRQDRLQTIAAISQKIQDADRFSQAGQYVTATQTLHQALSDSERLLQSISNPDDSSELTQIQTHITTIKVALQTTVQGMSQNPSTDVETVYGTELEHRRLEIMALSDSRDAEAQLRSQLQSELEHARETVAAVTEESRSQVKSKILEVKKLRSELEQAQAEITQQTEALTESRSVRHSEHQIIQRLDVEMSKIRGDHNYEAAQVRELQSEIRTMQAQLDASKPKEAPQVAIDPDLLEKQQRIIEDIEINSMPDGSQSHRERTRHILVDLYVNLASSMVASQSVLLHGESVSKQGLYLKAQSIDNKNARLYYLLASTLNTNTELIDLKSGFRSQRLGKKGLYLNSIRLGIQEPDAYIRLADLLGPEEGVFVKYHDAGVEKEARFTALALRERALVLDSNTTVPDGSPETVLVSTPVPVIHSDLANQLHTDENAMMDQLSDDPEISDEDLSSDSKTSEYGDESPQVKPCASAFKRQMGMPELQLASIQPISDQEPVATQVGECVAQQSFILLSSSSSESIEVSESSNKRQPLKDTAKLDLFTLATTGDLDGLTNAIHSGSEIKIDDNGRTLLWIAAKNDHFEVVKFLAETLPETIILPDKNGCTPLYAASEYGHCEIVKFLAEKSPESILVASKNKFSPVWIASHKGHFDIVKFLAEKSPESLSITNTDGATPLWIASHKGHFDIVKFLAEKIPHTIAQVDTQYNATPLYVASEYGHLEIVKLLAKKSPGSISIAHKNGFTPLFIATRNKFKSISELLLKKMTEMEQSAADNSELNNQLYQSLFIAVEKNDLNLIKFFASHYPNLTRTSRQNNLSILHIACEHSDTKTVQYIMEQAPDLLELDIVSEMPASHFEDMPDWINKDGLTPLYYAVRAGKIDTVEWLLSQKPSLLNDSTKKYHMHNLIIVALKGKHYNIAKLLIEKKPDSLDSTDEDGNTPLFIATRDRSLEMARHIGSRRPKAATIKNLDNNTPLYIAIEEGYSDIVTYFLEDLSPRIDDTCLELAVQNNHWQILDNLFNKSKAARTNSRNTLKILFNRSKPEKVSPALFSIALRNGQIDMMKYIVQKDESILGKFHEKYDHTTVFCTTKDREPVIEYLASQLGDSIRYTKNKNGETPLWVAVSRGKFETVQYLALKAPHTITEPDNATGSTPLHVAVRANNTEIAKFLVKKDPAMIWVADKFGKTPLDIACDRNNRKMIILLSKGSI